MHGNFIGIDPYKDYLLDPQQQDSFPGRCCHCRGVIKNGEIFFSLDNLVLCGYCMSELSKSAAILEDIRYGA